MSENCAILVSLVAHVGDPCRRHIVVLQGKGSSAHCSARSVQSYHEVHCVVMWDRTCLIFVAIYIREIPAETCNGFTKWLYDHVLFGSARWTAAVVLLEVMDILATCCAKVGGEKGHTGSWVPWKRNLFVLQQRCLGFTSLAAHLELIGLYHGKPHVRSLAS